jgi:hypothetical protein
MRSTESNADRLTQNLQSTANDTSDIVKQVFDKSVGINHEGMERTEDYI